MDTYTLNQPLLPGRPLSHEEHHRTLAIFVIVIAIAAALSAWYLLSRPGKQAVEQQSPDDALRAKVASLLEQAPVNASPTDVDKVTTLLSQSDTASDEAERQTVANALSKYK